MKKPLKHISLQQISPAFKMKAGDDSGLYWANRPRAPDVNMVKHDLLIFKIQAN